MQGLQAHELSAAPEDRARATQLEALVAKLDRAIDAWGSSAWVGGIPSPHRPTPGAGQ